MRCIYSMVRQAENRACSNLVSREPSPRAIPASASVSFDSTTLFSKRERELRGGMTPEERTQARAVAEKITYARLGEMIEEKAQEIAEGLAENVFGPASRGEEPRLRSLKKRNGRKPRVAWKGE